MLELGSGTWCHGGDPDNNEGMEREARHEHRYQNRDDEWTTEMTQQHQGVEVDGEPDGRKHNQSGSAMMDECVWDTPDDTEILTLEERQVPRGKDEDGGKELIEKVVTSSEQDWRIFRHGAPTEEAKEWVVETLKETGDHHRR